MKTHRIQNTHILRGFVSRAVVFTWIITIFALLNFSTSAGAQSAALTNTFAIDNLGITVSYPDGWSVGQATRNSWVVLDVPADQQETVQATVRVVIGYLERTDHADAVSQLADIASEYSTPCTFLTIGGWPGLQRVQLIKRPQPSQAPLFPDPMTVQITTAVAAGNLLVRLQANLPSDASQALKDTVLAIGQSLTFSSAGDPAQVQQELLNLQSLPRRSASTTALRAATTTDGALGGGTGLSAGAAAAVTPATQIKQLVTIGTTGELEIVASNHGKNIVVAKQSTWQTSNDGGKTFPFSGSLPVNDGDSSLAFGQSGNFYHAALACFTTCSKPCPANSTCVEVAASTDNGQTFPNLVNSVVCPNSGGSACSVDQEHIAADRVNAAVGGKDRVYTVVRNCLGGCGSASLITCSPDSGANWAPTLALETGADFPRITVGQDGFVYVVYRNGGNFKIDKYNACTSSTAAMTRAGAAGDFPKTVSAFTTVAGCEAPNGLGGLDRCNDGNILSSPMVGVDDTNPNHIYVSFATNTSSTNEEIRVADSINGGVNWRTPVMINTNVPGRRFLPWLCTTGGDAFVTWYDRRKATATQNDRADYFTASAGLDAGGNLVANNDEFQINTITDLQCDAAGWASAPRSVWDSENCSTQPQLAGQCSTTTATSCDYSDCGTCGNGFCAGTTTACTKNSDCTRSAACQCPSGESCNTGNPNPKYGDYDANACAAGRLFAVWASASQTGLGGDPAPSVFFQALLVAAVPLIQVPGSVALPDACVGNTSIAPLNVCNTGNADLDVNSIGSTNSEFAVAPPSSGFPVVISPDFCFPFQVSFKPTSTGAKTANLTIVSNDPANPSITVQATGTGSSPIATTSGALDFGQLCTNDSKTQTVQLCDTGNCNLIATGATLAGPNCANFTLISPSSSSFPLTISHDSCFGFVVKSTPNSLTPPDCSLVIATNDPANPTIKFPITAAIGSPHIVLDPTALSGMYEFPATVVDPNGSLGCYSDKTLVIRNNGTCPLNISGITATTPFKVIAPTQFPVILSPGQETLNVAVRFAPTTGGGSPTAPNETTGTLTVTSNDPGGAASEVLCGEAVVQSGVRVLVVDGSNTPIDGLDSLTLTSRGVNTPKPIIIRLRNVSPATATVCHNTIQYHLDSENLPPTQTTGSYPKSSYIISARERNKLVGQTFNLGQCEFKQFILKLQ